MSTTGEEVAADFSANKAHLTEAEQRRLADMIDNAIANLPTPDAVKQENNASVLRCHACKDNPDKYPDGECQHGFYW